MKELVLKVTGMDCRDCEERIERLLAKVDGVRRVAADHRADRVRVVLDDPGAAATVRSGITKAGFEVRS
ncbi:MAG: heavy-metal-associated domain-containing protein [Acidimicrobiales bacterium]